MSITKDEIEEVRKGCHSKYCFLQEVLRIFGWEENHNGCYNNPIECELRAKLFNHPLIDREKIFWLKISEIEQSRMNKMRDYPINLKDASEKLKNENVWQIFKQTYQERKSFKEIYKSCIEEADAVDWMMNEKVQTKQI